MARYATQKAAADAIGVGLDRYETWEKGRTNIPPQYLPAICVLFRIDANYLYDINPVEAPRKTG